MPTVDTFLALVFALLAPGLASGEYGNDRSIPFDMRLLGSKVQLHAPVCLRAGDTDEPPQIQVAGGFDFHSSIPVVVMFTDGFVPVGDTSFCVEKLMAENGTMGLACDGKVPRRNDEPSGGQVNPTTCSSNSDCGAPYIAPNRRLLNIRL